MSVIISNSWYGKVGVFFKKSTVYVDFVDFWASVHPLSLDVARATASTVRGHILLVVGRSKVHMAVENDINHEDNDDTRCCTADDGR